MLLKTGPLQDLFRFDTAGKTRQKKIDTTWLGRGVQACLGGQRLEEAEGGAHEGGAAGRAHRRRVAGRNYHTHRLHQQRRAEANLHAWRQRQNPHSRAGMQRRIHHWRAHSASHNPVREYFLLLILPVRSDTVTQRKSYFRGHYRLGRPQLPSPSETATIGGRADKTGGGQLSF
jgi:hypothetical protein